MKTDKRISLSVLPTFLCLLAMLVAACGGSSQAPSSSTPQASGPAAASADKQIFRFPLSGDIATFDPAQVQDSDSINAIQMVFTGLVSFDNSLNVVPQMASSYSLGADKTTWTFKLKPNLKFSDGTALTSQDILYSINRVIDPATKSVVVHYLSLIQDFDKFQAGKVSTLIGDSLLAPDPSTVVIKTTAPSAYFLQTLTYPTSYVVEKKIIDKYGTTWTDHLSEGGGSGPYEVQTYSHTAGITFVPNKTYYSKAPKLQKVIFNYYNTTENNYQAYQAKQVDLTIVPPENLASVKNQTDFTNVPQLSIIYFTMNYLAKPFDNIKIRQAFALSINKDLLAHNIYKDSYTATNHIVPQGMAGYDQNLTGPAGVASTAGDPVKAKQLLQEGLQEAGYASAAALPKLLFSYYPRSQVTKQFITAIIQMWNTTLGVNVQQQTLDFNKLQDLQTGTKDNPKGLQMWRAAWGSDYPDPQDWLSIFFQKGQDYNEQNYGQNNSSTATEQQQVQQQLLAADVNADNTARIKAYNNAEQAIINDVGWIPIFQAANQYLTNTKIYGLKINAQAEFPPDSWANVYVTA